MNDNRIDQEKITQFEEYLRGEEKAQGTIEKYMRDVRGFAAWLSDRSVTKELVSGWKEYLQEQHYALVTVNSMLAAINAFFRFADWNECRVKFLKIQRRMFREADRELTRTEYERLLTSARALGKDWLALLMETICATCIRVSEVRYITVEAARFGRVEIDLKSLSRRQIWSEMKKLCSYAGIEKTKVFPHNLRHLFATAAYQYLSKNIEIVMNFQRKESNLPCFYPF